MDFLNSQFNSVTALYVIIFLWAFWALYVFSMGVYRAYLSKRLVGINYYLALPIFILGFLVDVIANFSLAVIVFVDVPHELLVTQRLIRYRKDTYPNNFRKKLATFICDNLLDIFDPRGDHC